MEGLPQEDLKEHERQKQGKSEKNSDSDDEAPAKKHRPENQNSNNAISGLSPGVIQMPPQFPPMLNVAPPFMSPGSTNADQKVVLVYTVGASSKIVHPPYPPEDVSLEEYRARLPKYKTEETTLMVSKSESNEVSTIATSSALIPEATTVSLTHAQQVKVDENTNYESPCSIVDERKDTAVCLGLDSVGLIEKSSKKVGTLYKIPLKSCAGLDLTKKTDRMKTFNGFRKTFMIKRLAASGFYYSGYSDMVVCYNCHLRIYNLHYGEDPAEIHLEKSKTCGLAEVLKKMVDEREPLPTPTLRKVVIC